MALSQIYGAKAENRMSWTDNEDGDKKIFFIPNNKY